MKRILVLVSCAALLGLGGTAARAQFYCGNYNQGFGGGSPGDIDDCDDGSGDAPPLAAMPRLSPSPTGGQGGINKFKPYNGNFHRVVTDLTLAGGVGQHRLAWKRVFNGRPASYAPPFGDTHSWRHSYYWEIEDRLDYWTETQNVIRIIYPDGTANEFSTSDNVTWRTTPAFPDVITLSGTNYTLQIRNGWRYIFNANGDGTYNMQGFYDAQQNWYSFSYDSSNRLAQVTEPAGRYFQISYDTNNFLSQVTASDGRSVTYGYEHFDPQDPNSNWVLASASYGDGTQAAYEYAAGYHWPLLVHAVDPRYPGPGANIRYTYYTSWGFGASEQNGVTTDTIASFNNSYGGTYVTYANGANITYNIDISSGGLPASKSNATGGTRSYGYDQNGAGFPIAMTNELGGVTLYTNTVMGNLLARVNPDGGTETWTRDDLDLVLTYTDALNRTTTYTRDTNTHLITRIDYPDGNFEAFTYNAFCQVLTRTNRNGGVDAYGYSTNGLLLVHTNALGYVTAYTCDSADRIASVTDARGNATSYLYNDRGQVTKVTFADSSWQGFGYDTFGNKTVFTNELGKVWTWGFNELRQMTNATDPLGRVTLYSYDAIGNGCCGGASGGNNVSQIIRPGGQVTAFGYDLDGHRTSITNALGSADASTNYFQYDVAGNMTNRIDGNGKSWLRGYDTMNHLVSATDPLTNTTAWGYDLGGNKIIEVRADGRTNRWAYDSMNRVTNTTDTLGQQTAFAYNAAGKMTVLTDARGNSTGWGYDLLGHQLWKTYADGNGDLYAYDAAGNLVSHTNAAGEIHYFTYDARNRNTTNWWSTTNGATTIKGYDAAGRLTALVHGSVALVVTNTYSYDDANELLAELTQLSTITNQLQVGYGYNTNGQRSTLTYPDTSVVSYTYTDRGQVSGIYGENQSPLAAFTYDLNGNRLTKSLANGTTANYAYDDASRLTQLQHVKAAVILAEVDYALDSVNRRTNRVEQLSSGGPVTDTYAYDGTDQVTNVVYAGATTVGYAYDALGNLTVKNTAGNSTNYSANNLNQYTNIGGNSLAYDAKGNTLTRPGWTYTWDAQNRLLSATGATNRMEFAYDGRNRCINRKSYVWDSGTSSFILQTSSFLTYDGWSLIDERDGSGTVIARYVNGPIIDELLRRTTAGTTNYYHGDGLNSTVALTDGSGNVQERYKYDVFGMPSFFDASMNALSASAYGNRTLFQGREWLAEVTLNDHRHRYYAPEMQRWISRDPIEEFGGINIQGFALNNPLTWMDPLGLDILDSFFWLPNMIDDAFGQFCEWIMPTPSSPSTPPPPTRPPPVLPPPPPPNPPVFPPPPPDLTDQALNAEARCRPHGLRN